MGTSKRHRHPPYSSKELSAFRDVAAASDDFEDLAGRAWRMRCLAEAGARLGPEAARGAAIIETLTIVRLALSPASNAVGIALKEAVFGAYAASQPAEARERLGPLLSASLSADAAAVAAAPERSRAGPPANRRAAIH